VIDKYENPRKKLNDIDKLKISIQNNFHDLIRKHYPNIKLKFIVYDNNLSDIYALIKKEKIKITFVTT
jgi:hypothetical protein